MSAPRRGFRHPVGLAIGLILLVPQVVIAVVVVTEPLAVAIIGFLMTVGFIRLGALVYQVARERVPPVNRGLLALIGFVAVVAGALLRPPLTAAAKALGDAAFRGGVAPPEVIGLNLLLIADLGLYVCGAVLLIAAAGGALLGRTRQAPAPDRG